MNYLDFYGNRRGNFPVNTEIDGGAIEFPTRIALADYLNIPSTNIKSFVVQGNDIKCHMSKDYRLPYQAFSKRYNKPGADTITAYRDLGAKVIGFGSFSFSLSVVEEVIFPRVNSIANAVLRDLKFCSKFIAPNVTSIGNSSLVSLGSNTSGLDEGTTFVVGELQSISSGLGGAKIRFNRQYPLVTSYNNGIVNNGVNVTASVFPNIEGHIGGFGFRNTSRMIGHDYPLITSLSGHLCFDGCFDAQYIRLINLRTIVFNTNGNRQNSFINDCFNLTELDIRKCNNFPDPIVDRFGDPRSEPYYNINGNNANLTVHAHVDLKTSGNWFSLLGTDVHASLQKVINDGGTVNWYNEDGTFNSTNNN